LKGALLFKERIIVTNVPYHLKDLSDAAGENGLK
jgi:hypothetical protein